MPDRFLDLVAAACLTVGLTLLWAVSVALTYWDTHRRRLTGDKALIWLAVVALLPMIGFAAYALVRVLGRVQPARAVAPPRRARRETALKRPAAGPAATGTMMAADIAMHTIVDAPKEAPEPNARPAASAGYALVVSVGTERGREFVVRSFPAQLGRGAEAMIALEGDLGVSRRHAELYVQEGALRIRDLRSTHGTQVNGRRVTDQRLSPGDIIQVGNTVLVVGPLKE